MSDEKEERFRESERGQNNGRVFMCARDILWAAQRILGVIHIAFVSEGLGGST